MMRGIITAFVHLVVLAPLVLGQPALAQDAETIAPENTGTLSPDYGPEVLSELERIKQLTAYTRASSYKTAQRLIDIRLVLILLLIVSLAQLAILVRREAGAVAAGAKDKAKPAEQKAPFSEMRADDSGVVKPKRRPYTYLVRWATIQIIVFAIVLAILAVVALTIGG